MTDVTTSLQHSKLNGPSELYRLFFRDRVTYNSTIIQNEIGSFLSSSNDKICSLNFEIFFETILKVKNKIEYTIQSKNLEIDLLDLVNFKILETCFFNDYYRFLIICNDYLFKKSYTQTLVKPVLIISNKEVAEKLPYGPLELSESNKLEFKFFRATVKRIGATIQRATIIPYTRTTGTQKIVLPQKLDKKITPPASRTNPWISVDDEIQVVDTQYVTFTENSAVNLKIATLAGFFENELCNKFCTGEELLFGGIIHLNSNNNKDGPSTFYLTCNILFAKKVIEVVSNVLNCNESKLCKIVAQHPNMWTYLRGNIAPHIKGHEIIKDAICLQAFAAESCELGGTKFRRSIHVLIVGDAGLGKSHILKAMVYNTGGMFISAAGSSAVGLTAAVVKDEQSGQWMVEAGAMVLADRRFLCIDELDKIKTTETNAIHEALQQQTISISKAGINTTLNSRMSVLAAANPKYGRFNSAEPLLDQINMPITLLSRFDLIFTLKDSPNKKNDSAIMTQIFDNYQSATEVVSETKYTLNQLSSEYFSGSISIDFVLKQIFKRAENIQKYISFIKNLKPPNFSDSVKERVNTFYTGLRISEQRSIVTFRQAESLIRLIEAKTRSRYSSEVSISDVEFCIGLIIETLKNAAGKETLSEVDNNILDTGISTKSKVNLDLVYKYIITNGAQTSKTIIEAFPTLPKDDLQGVLIKLERLGLIQKLQGGKFEAIK